MRFLNKVVYSFLFLVSISNCGPKADNETGNAVSTNPKKNISGPYLVVLGTTQDAGSPQIGCTKKCCEDLFIHPDPNRQVVSLGLVDPMNKMKYLFEATPDITRQTKNLLKHTFVSDEKEIPDGIFLTHAHIGHYSGLMYLGKEALNADSLPVYVMPRMRSFLENNGPWSQLIKFGNIVPQSLENEQTVKLVGDIKVTALLVPHRDEFSETVAYLIEGSRKKVLFMPDIDKWEKWERSIVQLISTVDFALIDGTFYDGHEVNNRNIKEIPHPFIIESMALFKDLSPKEKSKIYFIHFNHTNPALDEKSQETHTIKKNGFGIAQMNQFIEL